MHSHRKTMGTRKNHSPKRKKAQQNLNSHAIKPLLGFICSFLEKELNELSVYLKAVGAIWNTFHSTLTLPQKPPQPTPAPVPAINESGDY